MDIVLILLTALGILLTPVVALLLIPVDISFSLFKEGPSARQHLSFKALSGAASGDLEFGPKRREFRLRILGATIIRRDLKERKERPIEWRKIIENFGELYDSSTGVIKAVAKSLCLKEIKGKVKVGRPDPSRTGMLIGFLYAGGRVLNALLPRTGLEFEPSFSEEKTDVDVELSLKLPIFRVVLPLVRFLRTGRKVFAQ